MGKQTGKGNNQPSTSAQGQMGPSSPQNIQVLPSAQPVVAKDQPKSQSQLAQAPRDTIVTKGQQKVNMSDFNIFQIS